ncbi:MAG TPA: sensor domain-containing diguanylate cyclase [Acidimicrobiales bacterium]|nr:sensor domain-containing diguanylate cyclase [Acidimicrobiales bacterium]
MEAAPFASDETGRLFALQELRLLDTAAEARFDRFVQLAARLSGAPIGIMSVVAERRIFFKSAYGAKPAGIQLGQPSREYWFCSHVVASGRPLVVANAREDDRFREITTVAAEPGLVAYAGVPIRAPGGEVIGALAVLDTVAREFPESEVPALLDLAALIEAELSPLPYVTTDALTGAMNARSFDRIGNRMLEFGDRRGLGSVMLRADVAGLGQINRTQGTEVGDHVLAEAAQLLERTVRGSDLLARIGPDEFAILLIGADTNAARLVIDRIVVHALEHNRTSGNLYTLAFHLGGAVHLPGEAADVGGLLVTANPQRPAAPDAAAI